MVATAPSESPPIVAHELFVSRDLMTHERSEAEVNAVTWFTDVTMVDASPKGDLRRTYRRLDHEWFIWLYASVQRAEQAAAAGRLAVFQWLILEHRWAAIDAWAAETWGPETMGQLYLRKPSDNYRPTPRVAPYTGGKSK